MRPAYRRHINMVQASKFPLASASWPSASETEHRRFFLGKTKWTDWRKFDFFVIKRRQPSILDGYGSNAKRGCNDQSHPFARFLALLRFEASTCRIALPSRHSILTEHFRFSRWLSSVGYSHGRILDWQSWRCAFRDRTATKSHFLFKCRQQKQHLQRRSFFAGSCMFGLSCHPLLTEHPGQDVDP